MSTSFVYASPGSPDSPVHASGSPKFPQFLKINWKATDEKEKMKKLKIDNLMGLCL